METLAKAVTIVFIILIVCLAIWDMISYWDRQGKFHRNLKGEMTGLGILGTFIGIFIGLWEFNADAIKESIPPLLEGLKTAFITSIAGLTASVFITVLQTLIPSRYAKTGDPVADKVNTMIQSLDETMSGVKASQQAMTGEMSLMREDMKEALHSLSEGASKEIIAALEKVIRDFNENLTAQFGENFKELNEACGRLVKWQEDYLDTIRTTTTALEVVKAALEAAESGVAEHNQRARELVDTLIEGRTSIETMREMLTLMQENSEGLEATLARVDRLIDAADTHAASLRTNLADVVTKQKELQGALHLTLSQVSQDLGGASSHATKLVEKTRESVELSDGHIESAHKNLQNALTSLTEHFGYSYQKYLEGLRRFSETPDGRRGD
jgi:methyl-accepting chemotaxis protein